MSTQTDIIVIVSVQFFVTFVIITGNLIVCYVIFKYKRRSTPFILIGSQCLSDILYPIYRTVDLLTCSEWFATKSREHSLMCEFSVPLQVACYAVSAHSMLVIAVDRYARLYHPHHRKWSLQTVYCVVVIIWISAILLSLLAMINLRKSYLFPIGESCITILPELGLSTFFTRNYAFWTFTVLYTYIPLFTTSILYTLVIIKVRSLRVVGAAQQRRNHVQHKRERMIRMLITILVAYYALNTPVSVFSQISVIKYGELYTTFALRYVITCLLMAVRLSILLSQTSSDVVVVFGDHDAAG